uniref:Uncharacterized protein n=1 Tax=Anguilla anguilla TaxID=7936 RepID=A0A0E9QA11_ANGAN
MAYTVYTYFFYSVHTASYLLKHVRLSTLFKGIAPLFPLGFETAVLKVSYQKWEAKFVCVYAVLV